MVDAADAFAAVVNSLVRGESRDLAAVLPRFTDPTTLGAEGAVRFHFVPVDGNGRPRVYQLAKHLSEVVIDYCIPRTRIAEATEHLVRTGSTQKIVALQDEARHLFTTLEKSGEGGEIMLFRLLETEVGIPQLLCKMPLKTSAQMHYHGADGIHARISATGILELYWGESKMYEDLGSGLSACFESVAPLLNDSGGGPATRDLMLLHDNLDSGDIEITKRLIRYFSDDAAEASRTQFRAACLVAFSQQDYCSVCAFENDTVSAEGAALVDDCIQRVERVIDAKNLGTFVMEVFLVPLPDVREFRAKFASALGMATP